MSGIVGSRFNIRGSGLVGSLGTDGQVFTSAGAGKSAVFEDAAGGGKILQVVQRATASAQSTTGETPVATDLYASITPSSTDSDIIVMFNCRQTFNDGGTVTKATGGWQIFRDIGGAGYVANYPAAETEMLGFQLTGASGNFTIYTWPSVMYRDSPATTSEVTYKYYVYTRVSGGGCTTNMGAAGGGDRCVLLEVDGS